MNPDIDGALQRLNRRLPLAQRQAALPPDALAAHRAILRSLYETSSPPHPVPSAGILDRLGTDDLVVLSADGTKILGAYPMTTEPTPHRLLLPGRTVHAMCAVDALSVSPMFGDELEIESTCRVTGDPVRIRQNGSAILSASPGTVLVGVRWSQPCCGHAAHSLCVEMVFLRDSQAAQDWHKSDLADHTVLPLADAVQFGARFFKPLVSA